MVDGIVQVLWVNAKQIILYSPMGHCWYDSTIYQHFGTNIDVSALYIEQGVNLAARLKLGNDKADPIESWRTKGLRSRHSKVRRITTSAKPLQLDLMSTDCSTIWYR